MERCGDVPHGHVGDQDVVEAALRRVPRPWLEIDAGQHVVAVGCAVGVQARPIEQAVVYNQVLGRTDQTDSVAGRVDDAAGDHRVLPVTTRNRIIPGVEPTVRDVHVPTRMAGRPAKVYTVPSAGECDVVNVHVAADHEEDRVVCGIDKGDIAHGHVAAIDEHERVRSSHVFFPRRIEDLVAVDHASAADGNILLPLRQNEGAVPFAPPRLRHEVRRFWGFVQVWVLRPNQPGAGLQQQRDMALEMDGCREVPPRCEADLSPAGSCAGLHGSVDGRRIHRHAVANGPVIAHIEYRRLAGERHMRPRQQPQHKKPYSISITAFLPSQHEIVSIGILTVTCQHSRSRL